MTTRIYAVDVQDAAETIPVRLVRAGNPAQALRHITKKFFEVRVASQDDIVKAIGDGVKVEEAGDDAE